MAPGSLSYILHLFYLHFISFTNLQSLLSNLYNKNTKNIYFTISIISHFCKWPWRDWQPLYRVGCEVLICLCRCKGLERELLLLKPKPLSSHTKQHSLQTVLLEMPTTSWALRWFSLEEERVMQQSSVSISPSVFENQRYQSSRRPRSSPSHLHKQIKT